jgi:DNA polymerase-3 subunit alpha
MSYSSLHNHSYYSLQDGFASPKEYMERAKELGLKAIALTEHGNLYSAPYVHKLKKDYPDIKVIYGFEAYECYDHKVHDPDNKYFHLVVLARNEAGRIAVNKLITDSEFYGKYYKPRIDLDMLRPYADDLIITTACMASKLHRVNDYGKCVELVNEYKSVFNKDNFFLEMQSHRSEDQVEYNRKILQLAKDTDTPFIITTDSHAATKEQLEYQAIWVQIAHDAETASESYEGCYIQSVDEIHEVMDEQIGWEYVVLGLETTNYVADLCEEVQMPFQNPKLPTFPIPKGHTERSYIEHILNKGWETRGFGKMSEEDQKVRKERIDYELEVIDNMGFIGYFLIVYDFIKWGRQNGILFGDGGRGSGAGSMVCYLLGITGVDPIKYKLFFERFLNPSRIGLPDIDTDVHPKEKVIEYLQKKYGKMSVCQISNFSYSSPNVSVKDVIRVLDKDQKRFEKFGKKIGTKTSFELAKLFAYEKWEDCISANGNTIKQKYSDEIFDDVFRIAKELSNRVHHVSIHAGGVGIVDEEIVDYMPMRLTDKCEQVIQVDKKIIEDIGIVKFDLLGLNTLSIIKGVIDIAGIDHWEINPNNEAFINDEATYELIGSGDTGNVFQLESQGMKDLCRKIKPKSLDEMSDILALYRPDVMQAGMLDDYVNRKINGTKVEYIHPDMEKILGRTYGVQVYQEQSMEITRVFGGRSLAGADTLRKLLGKKLVDQIKPEISKLHQEIINNGYNEEVANHICGIMEGFGNYSFNQSHSLGYAVIALQTAYLKCHYTTAFYCSVLNACNNDSSKINKYMTEAQDHNVNILPPHINNSGAAFSVVDGKILFGLSAVTGVGGTVVDKIIDERNTKGNFKGIVDLTNRVPDVNMKQVVALIKAGAFGVENKEELLQKYLKYATKQKFIDKPYPEYKPVKTTPTLLVLKTEYGIDTKDKEERIRLFNEAKKKEHETVKYEEWKADKNKKMKAHYADLIEKYAENPEFFEFEGLNVFLTDNPFKEVHSYIQRPFSSVDVGEEMFCVGIISKITKKRDKNKRVYAYVNIYGLDGVIEGVCFATVYDKFINIIEKGKKVAIFGERSGEDTFVVKNIETIEDWLRRSNIKLKRQR